MSHQPEERPSIREMTEKVQSLRAIVETMGEVAREGIRELDRFRIAEHPDLDSLDRSMDNLYGGSFG